LKMHNQQSDADVDVNAIFLLFSININVPFERKDVLTRHVYKYYKEER